MSDLKKPAQMISGFTARRRRGLSAVSKMLGLGPDDLDPSTDWNSLIVASYLGSRPYCLYYEPAFTKYYRHLDSTYRENSTLFVSDFTSCGHDLWRAIEIAEEIAEEVEHQELKDEHPYSAVNKYLNPWYLRLVEQSFDSLLGLAVYRLLNNEGKTPPDKPRQIYEAIRKQGWYMAGEFYYPIMRNGIAHHVEFIEDALFSPISVIYKDAKGNLETLPYNEVGNIVTGMVDECLAYAFALRLFLLEHSGDSEVQQILQAKLSNQRLRINHFQDLASSKALVVQSTNIEIVNSRKQTRIECLYHTTLDEECWNEIIALLILANSWFPDSDIFFVELRPKSKDIVRFTRIEADTITRWVNGELTDQNFRSSFGPTTLIWPKISTLGRLRAKLMRTIPIAFDDARNESNQVKSELPNQLPNTVRVLTIDDISHNLARRYRGEFVIDVDNQADVRASVVPLMKWIKCQHLYHSPQSKERWRKRPTVYIAGFLYSREKRDRDRGAIPESTFYVGRFEWRDPQADATTLPSPMSGGENIGKGLTYEASPDWPPDDRFIPR